MRFRAHIQDRRLRSALPAAVPRVPAGDSTGSTGHQRVASCSGEGHCGVVGTTSEGRHGSPTTQPWSGVALGRHQHQVRDPDEHGPATQKGSQLCNPAGAQVHEKPHEPRGCCYRHTGPGSPGVGSRSGSTLVLLYWVRAEGACASLRPHSPLSGY